MSTIAYIQYSIAVEDMNHSNIHLTNLITTPIKNCDNEVIKV